MLSDLWKLGSAPLGQVPFEHRIERREGVTYGAIWKESIADKGSKNEDPECVWDQEVHVSSVQGTVAGDEGGQVARTQI